MLHKIYFPCKDLHASKWKHYEASAVTDIFRKWGMNTCPFLCVSMVALLIWYVTMETAN